MSDLNKHTPGPWHRDKYGNVVDSNGERVVMRSVAVACSGSDEYIARAESNTDLATAAPDLLEALEQITNVYASMRESLSIKYASDGWSAETLSIDLARAAIAKARGQS